MTADAHAPYEGYARPRPDLDHYDSGVGTGIFLVATRFTLADGSELTGFSSPAPSNAGEDFIGYAQPAITLPAAIVPLWFLFEQEPPEDFARQYYSLLQRKEADVFPLDFVATVPIAGSQVAHGTVHSFQGVVYDGKDFRFVERT